MQKIILAVTLFWFLPLRAEAKTYPPEAPHHKPAPQWIEEAITRHESRLDPYVINIAGVSHSPRAKRKP